MDDYRPAVAEPPQLPLAILLALLGALIAQETDRE